MKYVLMNEVNPSLSAIEQILVNRGIELEDIQKYLNTTDADIHNYELLGTEALEEAYLTIKDAMEYNWDCLVIVDSDCDGFTSAALLINYLYDTNEYWVENHVDYIMHQGKQHGLSDIEIDDKYSIIIVPDAGSNDYTEHEELENRGKTVIVLDHHEAEKVSSHAIIINNQLSDYPNKQLSGVGVTWQFCRYLDEKFNTNYAYHYLDLVALGLDADMMSLREKETKHLIGIGLEKDNVKNPFFYYLAEKNSYSLGGKLTPIGVAFYIAPYINAMVRSGTQEEKNLLFEAMLKFKAFDRVPSTKRGHKPGDTERIVDQAVRTVVNVKSRQTKSQNSGLDVLENMIYEKNLLDNKVLLLQLEPGSIPKNIAGLIANKFMAKYQRHTAILFRNEYPDEVLWEGSARGYSKSKYNNFKQLCETAGYIVYAEGHANAFGLGIADNEIAMFLDATNRLLADDSGETLYYVDYEYNGDKVNGYDILEIAGLDYLWGQDMPEALVAVEGIKITGEMLTLMSPDKNPTLKITLPNNIAILKFKSSQEEYDKLFSENGYTELNIIGTCNANEWNGNVTPQIFIKDYEITDSNNYYF